MRMLRSIVCAGLAMIAVGLCTSMPAVAAVPIDVHAIVQPVAGKDYPAPIASIVSQDVAALQSKAPSIEGDGGARSSIAASSHSFADTSTAVPAYRHIDPDIAG